MCTLRQKLLKSLQRLKLNNKGIADNSGFSLVELIVTVAIMGVVIGITSMSAVVINKGNVTKAASAIDDAFTTAKERAMTTTGTWTVVIRDDHTVSVVNEKDGNVYTTNTIPSNVKVTATGTAKDTSTELGTDYSTIKVTFVNLSGAINSFTVDGTEIVSTASNGAYYIECSYKDKKAAAVKFFSTGKHENIEQ